jgi:HAE1 family hydrophobic/amphiphilic exporter-1
VDREKALGVPLDAVFSTLQGKNAILIVEFAERLRGEGWIMTSFAFLMGVVPLMLATGAGASARKSLGTTVFGGMLLSTFVNLIFIPVLYVQVEASRSRVRRHSRPADPPPTANPP